MGTKIASMLDELAALRTQAAALEAALRAASPEIATNLDQTKELAGSLEADIKTSAKYVPESQAHTLIGSSLQLVWVAEKTEMVPDMAALATLAKEHGFEIPMVEKSVRAKYWAIKARKK